MPRLDLACTFMSVPPFIAAMVALTIVTGQLVALCAFTLLFLRFWGRTSWLVAALYSAIGGTALYVIFDQVAGTTWYHSILFG